MDISIRRAVISDCPRLLALIHELAEFEKADVEVTVRLDHFRESGFGKNPVWWAWVAEDRSQGSDGKGIVVGFALYYIRYSTWKGQRMYLEDLLVTQRARGKGVGKLLFDRLLEEAKEKHFSGIAWQVLNWNESAIHFYQKYPVIVDSEWLNCSISW